MPNRMTQIKCTIDSDTVSTFKARCASEGVSMTSVICLWMRTGQPTNVTTIKTDTRPRRRKAVAEIIDQLTDIMGREAGYRDNIPVHFEQRIDAADHACDQLEEAIACLDAAF